MLFFLQTWGWHVVKSGHEPQVLTPKRRVVSSQAVLPTASRPFLLPLPPEKVLECACPGVRERAVLSPQQGPIHQDCFGLQTCSGEGRPQDTESLGRSRDLIFRMKTWAEQRANLQLVVGKPFKPELSAVNSEKEGESP